MSIDALTFEVVLSGTYWDKKPQFSVWLDDHVIVQSEIAEPSLLQSIEFKREVDAGQHQLKIRLEKKLGISVIPNKRYSGAGYAFDIDTEKLFNKL